MSALTVILHAIMILGGVGLVFGVFIALANKQLWVWEDPRIEIVSQMLPNANCGACGHPGLPGLRRGRRGRARSRRPSARCPATPCTSRSPTSSGVDAGSATRRVARLLCAGGTDVAMSQAEYRGLPTCAAAAAVAGGGKGCAWGCLGLADCAVSCTFDAIQMSETGLPVVDVSQCTACGDCVDACPKGLFTILPLEAHLLVQCRNLIDGDDALEQCRVACTACGKCVQDAAAGLISIASGVAVVNYDQITQAEHRAVERCPTGAIVWLNGAQFARVPETVGSERA